MDITPIEKDQIQSYWVDVTQDPDFISQDLGIDKDRIIMILSVLSDEGKIDGFKSNESYRVKKFSEWFKTCNF